VGIGERTFHANWASPGWAPTSDGGRLVFGAGDGFLYGFGVDPVDDRGLAVLPERWRVDGNLPSYRAKDGAPIRYATPEGPSEFIGTPVYAEGLVYAAIGQDPEHGPGVGRLIAVDPADGSLAWSYEGIARTISTVAVHRGIVYAVDYDGRLHALDARTGRVWWVHETRAHVWGSPYVVGKVVYLGNEDGILTLLAAGKKKKVLREVTFPAPIYSTPVHANGTLYVATQTHLYAFDGK
jgi:outer membrane protein assembly factor BamB